LINSQIEFFEVTTQMTMQCEQRANYTLDLQIPFVESTLLPRRRRKMERRVKPRSSQALRARAWGVDIDDHPFSIDCDLDNISSSGLYLRIPRRMRFSSALSLVVRLLNGPHERMSAAIRGTVIREHLEADGTRGVGVRIVDHSFI
jgi:hypothetical protein